MQAAEEIASEIERQIRDTSTKIDSFIASQSQELSRVQQDHEHTMRDLEAKIQRLKHEHGSVGDRYQSLQGQLAMERVRLEDRQGEVGRLEASASSLPAEVETSKAKEEAAQRQYSGAKQGACVCGGGVGYWKSGQWEPFFLLLSAWPSTFGGPRVNF